MIQLEAMVRLLKAGCFALATLLAVAAPASAEKYASIVVDHNTSTVLHARHADAPRHPASLTKVMTLYLLFDEIEAGRIGLDDAMAVSAKAAAQPPSKIRVRAGRSIAVDDAITALVTKSANDVAVVIAEHIGGSEDRFAALMTVKARMLGMNDTTFRNASGLHDPEQVTTARDMAILAAAIMEDHPAFYGYFSETAFRYGRRTYINHNKLLKTVEGVDGIKTGYTRASGFNLMAAAERDGHRVIAIMLGGHSAQARNGHVQDLIEAAFQAIIPAPVATALASETPDPKTASAAASAQLEPSVAEPETKPMRTVSFETIRDPVHPDAAAVPMLNGKPFAMAEGDTN